MVCQIHMIGVNRDLIPKPRNLDLFQIFYYTEKFPFQYFTKLGYTGMPSFEILFSTIIRKLSVHFDSI